MPFKMTIVVFLSFLVFVNICAEDLRVYQHGIDFVPRLDGHYWLIWASSGNPPTGETNDGSWIHDIYYSEIDPENPVIEPHTIISNDEAQEPASSAVADNGNIMITNEDGWQASNWIAQRYGVYDNNLSDVKPYPNMVLDGGHSGHVTAVANRFIVFYSEGWVDGGGVDNLGSGDDVMLKVYDSNGKYEREKDVSVGITHRDWWPLAAGSPGKVLLLWQRFVKNQEYADLMYSVYNPGSGTTVKGNTKIEDHVKYYTYDVQYIGSIGRFLILGTYYSGGGFAVLVDENGIISARNTELPSLVREAQPAIKDSMDIAYALYPSSPNGLVVLTLTDSSIFINNTVTYSYAWSYIGTDGIFTGSNSVYFVSLSKNGYVEKSFDNVIAASSINGESTNPVPQDFKLGQNFPNPFNSATRIPVYLGQKAFINIQIYDINGNIVDTLVNKENIQGRHEFLFNAKNLPSGLYYYRLHTSSGFSAVKKLIVIK